MRQDAAGIHMTPLDAAIAKRRAGSPPGLALGTMNFGRRTPEREARRIVDRALERGVTTIDTANVYENGLSETIVGRAIGGRRERVAIATKCGLMRRSGRPEGLAPGALSRALDESLARLGVERVDVFYLHAPDPATPIEETLAAAASLVASGKVARLGVSNFASWQVLEMIRLADEGRAPRPAIGQVLLNALVRQVEVEYLRFAERYGVATTVYNALAGGLLSGRHHRADAPAPGSRFESNAMYRRRYFNPRLIELVEAHRAIADELGVTLVALAYAWLASRPGVDSILVGPTTVAQLDEAIDAASLALAPETLAAIDDAHRAFAGTDATYAR